MMRWGLLFIVLGALLVDLSVQDCRPVRRRIEASSYRDPDPAVSSVTAGGRMFTFSDTRECDDEDDEGITVTKIYYLVRANSQIIEFWGEVEGVSGSRIQVDLTNWVSVDSDGNEVPIVGENFAVTQDTGSCSSAATTIMCEQEPGGMIQRLIVSADAQPVEGDPKVSVRLNNLDWDERDSELRLKFDLGGCLDELDEDDDGDVSKEQQCSDERAIIDYARVFSTPSGNGEIEFSEGSDDSQLVLTLEDSDRQDSLEVMFSIQVLVPGELDGNVDSDDFLMPGDSDDINIDDSDDGDNNNNNNNNSNDDDDDDSDNSGSESGDDDDDNNDDGDDDDSDSGASTLGTGFSIAFSLLLSLLFLLPN